MLFLSVNAPADKKKEIESVIENFLNGEEIENNDLGSLCNSLDSDEQERVVTYINRYVIK